MVRALVHCLLLLLLAPAAARGAEAELHLASTPDPRGGGPAAYTYALTYRADPGESNDLRVRVVDGASVAVEDAGATVRAGAGCAPHGAGVVCAPPASFDPVVFAASSVNLGDGDDRAELSIGGGNIAGEEGHDTIAAGGYVRGGPGDDTLTVARYGYADGGPGADRMTGERSTLKYPDRTSALRVTFDGAANDGEAGEGDDVRGVFDWIEGGAGDDHLESPGGPSEVRLWGFGGDDEVVGVGGGVLLVGADGNDTLTGGDGDDQMNGDAGTDLMRGGPGTDGVRFNTFANVTITPDDRPDDGPPGENDDVGSDVEDFATSVGNDRIQGTDGPNAIDSGGGDDLVEARGGDDSLIVGCCGTTTIDGGPGRDHFHPASRAYSSTTLLMRDGEADVLPRCIENQTPRIEADPIDDRSGCASFLTLRSDRSLTIRASGRRPVGVAGTCTRVATERCTGQLRMYVRPGPRRERRLLALGRYDVAAGKRRVVRLAFTSRGRRAIARGSRVRFVVTSHPDLNPPPSVAWPDAYQRVSGVLAPKRR
jgi:hypothetical protein